MKRLAYISTLIIISAFAFTACGSSSSALNTLETSVESSKPVSEVSNDSKSTDTIKSRTTNDNLGIETDNTALKLLQKGAKIESLYMDMEYNVNGNISLSKMWIDGEKTKTSCIVNNEETVSIFTGDKTISYNVAQKTGYEFKDTEMSEDALLNNSI